MLPLPIKVLIFTLFTACSIAKIDTPLPVVDYVDVNSYLGKWYEIARFDQSFQRGCTATTAEYSLRKDGDIKVLNSCRLQSPDGKLKKGIGRAWIADQETNAKLRVQFFLKSIKLPLFAGDYWIIELGENYDYAMVGDPTRQYLWILNRTNSMDPDLYEYLTQKASDLGFDTSKLIKTIH